MMKCMKYVVGALFILLAAPTLAAEERKTHIAFKAGGGNIQVNSEQAIDGIAEEQNIFSVGIFAGYNFDSGLVVEGGAVGATSDDIFESYDLGEIVAMAGYTFRPGKDFTIVPKLGFSIWELTVFDSNLFNLFGESEEFSYDGTDVVLSVEGEYSMTDLIQLNLSFNQGSYDFGDVSSYHFGVELDF